MDPPAPADNLLDRLDQAGEPSQENGEHSHGTEDGNTTAKGPANEDANNEDDMTMTTAKSAMATEDGQDETTSTEKIKDGDDDDAAAPTDGSQPVAAVTRQTLSQYQASKRRTAKQVRMTSVLSMQGGTLDSETPLLVEPDGMLRAVGGQHISEPNIDHLGSSSYGSDGGTESNHNNAYHSVPNLPTSSPSKRNVTNNVTKWAPSSGSHSPKSMKMNRLTSKQAKHPPKAKAVPQIQQQQTEKDIKNAYQRLRQTTTPSCPTHTPMQREDMKLGFATLVSQNHTSGAEPPYRGYRLESTLTSSSDDNASDSLTLLRDDSSDDGEDAAPPPPYNNQVAGRQTSQTRLPTPVSTRTPAPRSFDDSAATAEFARLGFRADRSSNGGGGGLPSRSEHGTKSTRMNQRRASLHPIIDENPQATTQQLEAELLRKSGHSGHSTANQGTHDEENNQEADPWPSALAYDPMVPGAHGISAPAAPREEQSDRREGLERYDSYRTNRDHYLVTATVVQDDEEHDEMRQKLARDRNERFRQLENRQEELEQQIQEQKRLILLHHEELSRLRTSHGEIVEAEVIGKNDAELDRQIRHRESIIAEKEAELQSMMGLPIPGFDVLRRYDHKKDRKKKAGLISKLNPFRKNNTESMRELDEDSSHSCKSLSTHSKKPSSSNKASFKDSSVKEADENPDNDDLDTTAHDAEGNDLATDSREAMLLATKKRSERFIAPEKLPFEDNTISELKQIAEDAEVDISGCVERGQIVKKLEEAGVKPKKKWPLKKLFGKPKSGQNSLSKSNHSPERTRKSDNKRSADIPPANMSSLREKRDSFYAPKHADIFEGISIAQLKKIARERNVDISTCTDRTDLVQVLYAAGMRPPGQGDPIKDPFENFSVLELKRVAASNNVDISSCVEKSQIIGALNIAGVSPLKKVSSSRDGPAFESMSISELKKIARGGNVDVSLCVEKKEIINQLRQAGVGPGATSNEKKAAPRLARNELADWRPSQLHILATQIGISSSGGADVGILLSKILHVANEEKKYLRAPIRMLAPLGSANLPKLRGLAKEKRVDVSGCVEKDEMLQRIVQKIIR